MIPGFQKHMETQVSHPEHTAKGHYLLGDWMRETAVQAEKSGLLQ